MVETVGGQSRPDGTFLVTPSGEVVGSTTPEVFEAGEEALKSSSKPSSAERGRQAEKERRRLEKVEADILDVTQQNIDRLLNRVPNQSTFIVDPKTGKTTLIKTGDLQNFSTLSDLISQQVNRAEALLANKGKVQSLKVDLPTPQEPQIPEIPPSQVQPAVPQSALQVIQQSRFNTPESTARGLVSALTSPFTEAREDREREQLQRIRAGKFVPSEPFNVNVGRQTAQGKFVPFTAEELRSLTGGAVAQEIIARSQNDLNAQVREIVISAESRIRPEFEQKQRDLVDRLQNAVNNGLLSADEANKELEKSNNALNKQFQQAISKDTKPDITRVNTDAQNRLRSDLTTQGLGTILATTPITLATTFTGGVALSATPQVIQKATAVASGGLGVIQASRRAEQLRTGEVAVSDLALEGTQIVVGATGFVVGAKVGRKVFGNTQIDLALQRAEVKARTKSVGTIGEINKLSISADQKTELTNLKRRGFNIRLIDTELVAGAKGDAKLLPNVKGKFVEISDSSGNLVRRITLGNVVSQSGNKQFTRQVIQQGIGILDDARANFEDIVVVGKVTSKGKFVPVEAYKTLEETVTTSQQRRGSTDLTRTRSTLERVGGVRRRPRPRDIAEVSLFDSRDRRTPLGTATGIERQRTRFRAERVSRPRRTGEGVSLFTQRFDVREGEGLSLFRQPTQRTRKPRKARRPTSLFDSSQTAGTQASTRSPTQQTQSLFRPTTRGTPTTGAKATTRKVAQESASLFDRTSSRTRLRQGAVARQASSLFGSQLQRTRQNLSLSGGLGLGVLQPVTQITGTRGRQTQRQQQGLRQATSLFSGTSQAGRSTLQPTPPRLVNPTIAPTPSLFPRAREPQRRTTRERRRVQARRRRGLQPSVGSILTQARPVRITERQARRLERSIFTGFEARPVFEIVPERRRRRG